MNKFRRALGQAAAAFVLAGAACQTQAAAVRITFDRNIFEGVPAPGYDNVRITYPRLDGSGPTSANTAAGRFQGTASNVVGVDPRIFVDNLNDVFMYCYDLYESISGGRVVDYQIHFDGETERTLDFLGAVNAVLNERRGTNENFAWLHPLNGAESAAIQLGIWESRFDASSVWSLSEGSFMASDVDGGTATQLASFIAAMPRAGSLDGRYAMVLVASGAQDMLAGDPPVAASVPATAWLAVLGLALAGTATRRGAGRPGPNQR